MSKQSFLVKKEFFFFFYSMKIPFLQPSLMRVEIRNSSVIDFHKNCADFINELTDVANKPRFAHVDDKLPQWYNGVRAW